MSKEKSARKLLATLLLFVLFSISGLAADNSGNRNILVICSHSETSDWANEMLKPVKELEQSRSDISFYTTYLRITSLSGKEEYQIKKEAILNEMTNRPDLVLLVGSSSFSLIDTLSHHWSGVPIILAGESDYYNNDEYTIRGKADRNAPKTLVESKRSISNLTLVQAPIYVNETIELVKSITPDFKRLIFIGGENYQSREQQIKVEDYLRNRYPTVDYELLLSTEMSTDDLIRRISTVDPRTTGIIFCSWLSGNDYMKNIITRNNILHMIQDYAPVVSMTYCSLENNRNVLGYLTYDHEQYNKIIRSRILEVIDKGASPRRMDFIRVNSVHPVVSAEAFQRYGNQRAQLS